MPLTTPRALIASDSTIARDPRVLKQLRWLAELGWHVDTLGRGPKSAEAFGEHYTMPTRPLAARLFAHFLLPNRQRHTVLVDSTIPAELRSPPAQSGYDLVIVNEIELLPWFVRTHSLLVAASGHAHLDLHEYSPSQQTGFLYRLVFRRYRNWLIAFIPSPVFASRSVVAEGIAKLYVALFGFAEPAVVRNAPPYVEQDPSPVDDNHIRLVHHGVASGARALDLLIDAVALTDNRFSLELMLVGKAGDIDALRKHAKRLGAVVTFRTPVSVHEISRALNEYDIEVIFYPPTSENMRFSLPNKFFEAVQGRLALVTGQSPEMAGVIKQYGNGIVVDGWSATDLAAALNKLTAENITAMKLASTIAANDLSSEMEKDRFLAALGLGEDV